MGLLDKLKNLFTDEEEIIETEEVEVEDNVEIEEPIEEESKLPTFMREKIEKEEKQINILAEAQKQQEEKVSDRELIKPSTSFKFPIAFEDKDFEITSTSNQNIMKKETEKEKKKSVAELYNNKNSNNKKDKKHVFKATPIISPVYGILDKNYKKDELKAKDENEYQLQRPSKKVDFESVRMKAYGTLSDEIKDNLLADEFDVVKETSKVEVYHQDELFNDIMKDDSNEDVSIGTAEENYYDFGVTYEVPKEKKEEVKIIDHNDENVVAEKIEVKEKEKDVEVSKKEDMELTDDLFNLIDSMYEEREDI